MSDTISIHVCPEGDLIMIFQDPVKVFLDMGQAVIKRASHVEPNNAGDWTADLSPVGGPVLGPFASRIEALTAEIDWLHDSMEDRAASLIAGFGGSRN